MKFCDYCEKGELVDFEIWFYNNSIALLKNSVWFQMQNNMSTNIKFTKFDNRPWGFRLAGGSDFPQPLTVIRVGI